jgi:trehalose-phosphatase
VLIQVATSTTEQAELDATVSDIVTRVNSTHSTLAHQPLVFLKQDIGFPQYLALITVAETLMITSLREGMNLTSHEFIFCQDGKYAANEKHGPLVLSEFTGSASVLGSEALLINPWDYRQTADAIKEALEMGAEDREDRWTKLNHIITHQTAALWFLTFISALQESWTEHSARDTISVPRLSINALGQRYRGASSRLFVLDYEGTLASWGSPTSIILTSPQRTLDVLTALLEDEKNIVYVMSGRRPEELERLFRRVNGVGLIAENGCFLREAGAEEWDEIADIEKMTSWKKGVKKILEYYKERLEGSYVEERHCSLIFEYSECEDTVGAARQAAECASHINDACLNQRVHAIPISGAVVVEPIDLSKASATTQIFDLMKVKNEQGSGKAKPDFLFVVGDAREDEVVFRWANKLAKDKVVGHVTTVSLGSRNTEATATLTQGVTGTYFRKARDNIQRNTDGCTRGPFRFGKAGCNAMSSCKLACYRSSDKGWASLSASHDTPSH